MSHDLTNVFVFSTFQAEAITDMIGFPDFILDPKKLDEKYEGVSALSSPPFHSAYIHCFNKLTFNM